MTPDPIPETADYYANKPIPDPEPKGEDLLEPDPQPTPDVLPDSVVPGPGSLLPIGVVDVEPGGYLDRGGHSDVVEDELNIRETLIAAMTSTVNSCDEQIAELEYILLRARQASSGSDEDEAAIAELERILAAAKATRAQAILVRARARKRAADLRSRGYGK